MLCAYSSLACVGVFLVLIDRIAKRLRPVGIFTMVGAEARKVIMHVYPRPLNGAKEATPTAAKA